MFLTSDIKNNTVMTIFAYKNLFTSLFISLLKHPRGRIIGIKDLNIILALAACQESCILTPDKHQTSHFTQPCPNCTL